MALIIRLRQQGCKNGQTYRMVVTKKSSPRDGKYIEKLGWYNPEAKEDKQLEVDSERVLHWLEHGALVSERAKSLIRRFSPEVIKAYNEKKQKARLKARAKKKEKAKKA